MSRPNAHDRRLPPQNLRIWTTRKLKSIAIADALIALGPGYEKSGQRMRDCAPQLMHLGFKSEDGTSLDFRTVFAGTCKGRLCETCSVLRSRRVYASVVPRFEAVLCEHPGASAALATFTVPNVPLADCRAACRRQLAAFRRMTQMKAFRQAVVGWMRTVEVTLNPKTRELHPHLHAVLIFRPGYFSKKRDDYVSQARWLKMWQKAMRDPSIKIVDIRRLRAKGDDRPLSSALAEVCKYPMKPMDLIARHDGRYVVDPSLLKPIHDGLRRLRLFAFGGVLRAFQSAVDEAMSELPDWVMTAAEIQAFIAEHDPEPYVAEGYDWQGDAYAHDIEETDVCNTR